MTTEVATKREPKALAADRPAWSKQPHESAIAFNGFVLYREMGYRRSITKVAQALHETSTGKKRSVVTIRSQVGVWSSTYRWQERIDLYELEVDRQRLSTREELQERVDREDYETASSMLRAASNTLDLLGATGIPIDPGQVPRYIEAATRIRRLALGMATDHVKAALQITVADLSRVVNDIVAGAIAQGFVPEERQEEFVRWVMEKAGS